MSDSTYNILTERYDNLTKVEILETALRIFNSGCSYTYDESDFDYAGYCYWKAKKMLSNAILSGENYVKLRYDVLIPMAAVKNDSSNDEKSWTNLFKNIKQDKQKTLTITYRDIPIAGFENYVIAENENIIVPNNTTVQTVARVILSTYDFLTSQSGFDGGNGLFLWPVNNDVKDIVPTIYW